MAEVDQDSDEEEQRQRRTAVTGALRRLLLLEEDDEDEEEQTAFTSHPLLSSLLTLRQYLQSVATTTTTTSATKQQQQQVRHPDDRRDSESYVTVTSTTTTTEQKHTYHNRPPVSVRTVLGGLMPADGVELFQLAGTLSNFMEDRIDTDSLMPLTQDDVGNEDAMDDTKSAQTLTKQALLSAGVYAQLIGMPGALGSGLIEMEALSALSNLLRRWRVECCGREAEMRMASSSNKTAATKKKKKKARRKGRRQQNEEEDEYEEMTDDEDVTPVKRKRNGTGESIGIVPAQTADRYEEDLASILFSVDDEDDATEENGTNKSQLTPHQLWTLGLLVANEVARVPLSKEFLSWKADAVETVLGAVADVQATASALAAVRLGRYKFDDDDNARATHVVEQATTALRRCILLQEEDHPEEDDKMDDGSSAGNDEESTSDDDDDETSPGKDSLRKRHETTISILRGLYPTILMKDDLPKGEAGKIAASEAASKTLEGFVQDLTGDILARPGRWPKSIVQARRRFSIATTAPTTGVPASLGSVTVPASAESSSMPPETPPQSNRKSDNSRMRTPTPSAGGSASRRKATLTPKLKASVATPAAASTTTDISASHHRSSPVLSAILGILQKLSTAKGLERAAIRTRIVETIHRCIRHLPFIELSLFLNFLIRLCYSTISVHRLVATELVGLVVCEEWLWKEQSSTSPFLTATPRTPTSVRKSLTPLVVESRTNMPVALFGALQGRLVDSVPTIRTTSAMALSKIFRRLDEHGNDDTAASLSTKGLVDTIAREADILLDSLRVRAGQDDKASVRRSACMALVDFLLVAEAFDDMVCGTTEQDINVLAEACQDNSMMTRKTASERLSLLMERVIETGDRSGVLPVMEKAWRSSTLTMVLDTENSCATKAIELVERLIFFPILEECQDNNDSTDVASQRSAAAAWNILVGLGDEAFQGASRSEPEALRVALQKSILLADSNSYTTSIFKKIYRVAVETLDDSTGDIFSHHIDSRRNGVWCLFDAAMGHSNDTGETTRIIKRGKIDMDFLGTSWRKLLELFSSQLTPERAKPALRRTMSTCLKVLSQLATCVEVSLVQNTAQDLQSLISRLSLPPEILGCAITAMVATTVASRRDDSEKVQHEECTKRIQSLFGVCENVMASFVRDLSRADYETLSRAIYVVGEVSLVGFSASEESDSNSSEEKKKKGAISNINAIGLHKKPSQQLVELVQAFMTEYLPGSDSTSTPDPVRAHAFLALGKLCLRDSRLAKSSLNILARELQHGTKSMGSWMVQSNALLVFGDLCVKYTNMVDRFLSVMAGCLQTGVTDITVTNLLEQTPNKGSALVRKHAILMLSNLLLQDYIKWRGLLFFRFLVATVDEDDDVATLAQMQLFGPLATKQPKLFASQFVESLFVLNRCTAHPIYQSASAMGDGGSGISVGFDGINLSGEAGRVRRMVMYETMLSRISDEEKIEVTARIGKEVFGSALKRNSELNVICTMTEPVSLSVEESNLEYESAFNVLSDAFAILSSPSIRVGKNTRDDDDIEDPNETSNKNKRVQVARGRLLSNVSRKHLIDILLPILCNLKQVLEKSRSPLLKDLMTCLLDIFQRYNEESQECLANDPTLLQELEYDAKQHKKAARQKTPGRNRLSVAQ